MAGLPPRTQLRLSAGITATFDLDYTSAIDVGPYTVTLGTDILVADGMFKNTTNNQLDLRFDRDIDPTSFTPANILRMTGPAGDVSEVQTLTLSGNTAGSFTLTFNGFTTNSLNGTATVTEITTELNALQSIGGVGGRVLVTQSGNVFTITFGGSLAFTHQPQITATAIGGLVVATNTVGFSVVPV